MMGKQRCCGTCEYWGADSEGNAGTCELLRGTGDDDGVCRDTHYTDACEHWTTPTACTTTSNKPRVPEYGPEPASKTPWRWHWNEDEIGEAVCVVDQDAMPYDWAAIVPWCNNEDEAEPNAETIVHRVNNWDALYRLATTPNPAPVCADDAVVEAVKSWQDYAPRSPEYADAYARLPAPFLLRALLTATLHPISAVQRDEREKCAAKLDELAERIPQPSVVAAAYMAGAMFLRGKVPGEPDRARIRALYTNEHGEAERDCCERAVDDTERRIVDAVCALSESYALSCEPSDAYKVEAFEDVLRAIDDLPRAADRIHALPTNEQEKDK